MARLDSVKIQLGMESDSRHMMDQRAAGGGPTFRQVLMDQRQPPLSRDEFRAYLDERGLSAWLDFLIAVQSYEEENMVASSQDGNKLRQLAQNVYATWLSSGQHNIPLKLDARSEVVRRLELFEKPWGKIFQPAEEEVSRILIQNYFDVWVKQQSSTNITKAESDNRYKLGALFLILGAAAAVAMWIFSDDVAIWFRLLTFIPFFIGFAYIYSGKAQV